MKFHINHFSVKHNKDSRKYLTEFPSTSNFFGINLLSKSKDTNFWIILWILLICFCLYGNILSIIDFLRYDVISSSKVYQTIPMLLPMITICNMNSYLSHKVLTIDQMLLDCQIGNSKCNISDFSKKFRISTYHCYSFNYETNKTIMQTSSKSQSHGINIKLYAGIPSEAKLYLNGFLILITNQTEFPLLEQAIQVAGGFFTRVKVSNGF